MREIKFRLWDESNKGYLKPEMFNVHLSKGIVQANNSAGQIGGVILEQFTGLKDSNSKDVYEGDTLKIYARAFTGFKRMAGKETPQYEVVHWTKDVEWDEYNLTYCLDGNLLTEYDSENIEIVGHIHDQI